MFSLGQGAPQDAIRGRQYTEMAGEARFDWEPWADQYDIEVQR